MQPFTSQDAVVKNLEDAGCKPDIISKFLAYRDAGRTRDSLRVLALHRASLLDELHASQDKLNCLDYLIYQIRKDMSKKQGYKK